MAGEEDNDVIFGMYSKNVRARMADRDKLTFDQQQSLYIPARRAQSGAQQLVYRLDKSDRLTKVEVQTSYERMKQAILDFEKLWISQGGEIWTGPKP